MLRWLRLVMISCLLLSIAAIATGCKWFKEEAPVEPAVEEAPVEPAEEEKEEEEEEG